MKKQKIKKVKTPKVKKEKIKLQKHSFLESLAFKFEITIFSLLLLLFSVLIFILNKTISRDSINSYSNLTSILAERSSAALTYWLSGYFKDLRVFTKSSAFLNADIDETYEYMMENTSLIGDDFEFVGVSGMDGILLTSKGLRVSIRETQYYKEIIEQGAGSCITNPEKSLSSTNYLINIALPAVDRDGRLFGLFMGAVPLSIIQAEVAKTAVGENGYAFVLDGNGTTIADIDENKVMKNFSNMDDEQSGMIGYQDMVFEMLMGQSGMHKIYNVASKKTDYVFYCPIFDTSWSLGLSVPKDEVFKSARRSGVNIALCCLVIAILILMFIAIYLNILLKPLLLLDRSITEIAKGDADLTKRLDITSKDEIGSVVKGFNKFIENLRLIISEVKNSKDSLQYVDQDLQYTTKETRESISRITKSIDDITGQITNQSSSVEETAGSVTQIAKNIESLNMMIENQSSGVTEASAAVEQMIGNIISVSKSTERMAEAFAQLEEFTRNGIEKQNIVNEQLANIEKQSQTLLLANKTISKIANKTNLLAMNAAIEAAHAGAMGQGFSVVADEIRNLSETSSQQSKSIGAELKSIQNSIVTVVASSSEAKEALRFVEQNIHGTDQLVQQIKGAMEESEVGSHQITDALKMMNDSTTEVRISSKEMSDGNKAILDEVSHLQEATFAIKSSVQDITEGTQKIDKNGSTLQAISDTMQKSIRKIGSQIDLFKV